MESWLLDARLKMTSMHVVSNANTFVLKRLLVSSKRRWCIAMPEESAAVLIAVVEPSPQRGGVLATLVPVDKRKL